MECPVFQYLLLRYNEEDSLTSTCLVLFYGFASNIEPTITQYATGAATDELERVIQTRYAQIRASCV